MARINETQLKCSCGVEFIHHKTGRCADVVLHRLIYDEVPELCAIGTEYTDGLRDLQLFEEDYLYERDGERYFLPKYTEDPSLTFTLLAKWNDSGGTGRLNMNSTGWSANFSHDFIGSWYGSYRMKRCRLEWLPIRALAARVAMTRIRAGEDATWIDGIDGNTTL